MFTSTENCLQLSQQIGEILLRKNWTLSTAESCTGGGLSSAITAIPGSSQWFGYGWVTYANEAKQKLLNVSSKTLEEYGAVSEQVVLEMVDGALKISGSNIAVAISGIAGPTGGTVEKPVGSVWFAFASVHHKLTKFQLFQGDRLSVQSQAVGAALEGLLDLLGKEEKNTV
jgi:nicotinamide-nucleotide amidase